MSDLAGFRGGSRTQKKKPASGLNAPAGWGRRRAAGGRSELQGLDLMWAPQFFSDPAAADRVPDGRSAFSEQLRNLLVPFAFCPEGLRQGLFGYTHQFSAAHFALEESEGGAGREKWKGGKALRHTETKQFFSHKFVASSGPHPRFLLKW